MNLLRLRLCRCPVKFHMGLVHDRGTLPTTENPCKPRVIKDKRVTLHAVTNPCYSTSYSQVPRIPRIHQGSLPFLEVSFLLSRTPCSNRREGHEGPHGEEHTAPTRSIRHDQSLIKTGRYSRREGQRPTSSTGGLTCPPVPSFLHLRCTTPT